MGATREAIVHYYDECIRCEYRDGHDCTYKKRIKEKCVWCRKKKNGYKLEEPKQTKCPLKTDLEKYKKEVLDAISREFRKSLQDIGATNGDVIKAMFPNIEREDNYGDADFYLLNGKSAYTPKLITFKSWLNAPFKAESEAAE